MYAGLGSLNGALPIILTIDSPTQIVGKQPTYRIQNASPGAQVFWSSEKDGKSTGELRAAYGNVVEANGSLEITGGNWSTDNVGNWRKEVEIQNPDGSVSTASVYFQVVPAQSASVPVINSNSSFLQTPLTYIGDFAITPMTVALGLGGVWLAKQLRIIK